MSKHTCLKNGFKSLHAGFFSCFFLMSTDFFQNKLFQKNAFRNIIRMSNGLEPDHDQQFVGPDLSPNGSQRLSTDDKSGR